MGGVIVGAGVSVAVGCAVRVGGIRVAVGPTGVGVGEASTVGTVVVGSVVGVLVGRGVSVTGVTDGTITYGT